MPWPTGPTDPPPGTTAADPTEAVAGWRADAEADGRRRRSWLARAAQEEATVAALLVDAAERGEPVVLALRGGRRVVGRVWSATPSLVAVRSAGGDDVLVVLDAVGTVQAGGPAAEAGAGPLPQGRHVRVPGDGSLAEALTGLLGDRPEVAVREADGTPLAAGELVAVGHDVASIRTDAGLVHVALASAATVAWHPG